MINTIQIPSASESTAYINSSFKDVGYFHKTFAKKIFNNDEIFRWAELPTSKEIAPFSSSCGPGVTLSNEPAVQMNYIKIPEMHLKESIELCTSLETQYWLDANKIKFAKGMTKKQMMEAGIFRVLQKQRLGVDLRKEKMAVDLWNKGGFSTASSYANGQFLDFKRDPALANFSLTPAQYFDNPTSSPLFQVFTNIRSLLKTHDFIFNNVLLSNKAFTALIQHQELRKFFETVGNPYGMISPLATLLSDVTVRPIMGINFHIYDEVYTEYQTGVTNRFLDENRAIFFGSSGGVVPLFDINGPINSMSAIKAGQENQDIYTVVYDVKENNDDQISVMSKSSLLMAGFVNSAVSSQVIA
jgi:hypothetical protein